MRVVVLGCGPAGLVAAHAAYMAGADVVVAAKGARKSHMYGAQYLHAPIPGIPPGSPQLVDYKMIGTPEDYRTKVYGPEWDGNVSPEDLAMQHFAWDIRHTYGWLWSLWEDNVDDVPITPNAIGAIKEHMKPDLIISTIPATALCGEGHTFRSQQIKAAGEAPDLGIKLPYPCPENTVICNGDPEMSWYRLSNIFGYKTVEWPVSVNPPISTTAVVEKPLKHNCICFPEIMRVGRYGAWKKGVLVHHVYDEVSARVRGL